MLTIFKTDFDEDKNHPHRHDKKLLHKMQAQNSKKFDISLFNNKVYF